MLLTFDSIPSLSILLQIFAELACPLGVLPRDLELDFISLATDILDGNVRDRFQSIVLVIGNEEELGFDRGRSAVDGENVRAHFRGLRQDKYLMLVGANNSLLSFEVDGFNLFSVRSPVILQDYVATILEGRYGNADVTLRRDPRNEVVDVAFPRRPGERELATTGQAHQGIRV